MLDGVYIWKQLKMPIHIKGLESFKKECWVQLHLSDYADS